GAEALLRRQLNAVLRGERCRQLRTRDEAAFDDRLAPPLAGHLLLRERLLELVVGQQTLLDEQPPEGTPCDVGRFHRLTIGTVASSGQARRAKCLYRGRSNGSRRAGRTRRRCRGRA